MSSRRAKPPLALNRGLSIFSSASASPFRKGGLGGICVRTGTHSTCENPPGPLFQRGNMMESHAYRQSLEASSILHSPARADARNPNLKRGIPSCPQSFSGHPGGAARLPATLPVDSRLKTAGMTYLEFARHGNTFGDSGPEGFVFVDGGFEPPVRRAPIAQSHFKLTHYSRVPRLVTPPRVG